MSIFGYTDSNIAKPVITIWAEENGFLSKDAYEFGFGNGGHFKNLGCKLLADGGVLRMEFLSFQIKGMIKVTLTIDGIEKPQNSISLDTERLKYVTFLKHLEVKAVSVFNFVSKVDNLEVTTSVVSLLIELNL